jgi:ABC-type Fe3+-hydroxamate transport system substrate-binding protein
MPISIDQTRRNVFIADQPRRIVSLVPSQTELLFDLGLSEELVGITKFCIHPDKWFRSKTRVGGTKNLHLDVIRRLQPDLIIANKEENVKEQVEELAKEFPVWVSDVYDLLTALEMIEAVGSIVGKQEKALEMKSQIAQSFQELIPLKPSLPAAYLIWREPYMTVGGDTFIHDMMQHAGFQNVFASSTRYPEVTIEELQQSRCQVVLLSSEPYPFRQKHVDELQTQLPDAKVVLVDGELFSWYGSRLLKAPSYFQSLMQHLEDGKS